MFFPQVDKQAIKHQITTTDTISPKQRAKNKQTISAVGV